MNTPLVGHELAERLAEIDDRRGESTKSAARKYILLRLRIDGSTLSRWVHGSRRPTRIDELALALGLRLRRGGQQ